MTTRAEQARRFNEAIAQGLTEDQALAAAGITNPDEFTYGFGNGQLEPAPLGPPARPNEVIVPRGSIRDDNDGDDIFVTGQTTTTSQTTVTGGSVTTTRYTPTVYTANDESRTLDAQARDLEAQKAARADELRAQGARPSQILSDPEYRRLSGAVTAKEAEAERAQTVSQAGDITVTRTPGPTETVYERTPDSGYVTNQTAGSDPQAEVQQITVDGTRSGVVDVTDPGFVPAADPQADRPRTPEEEAADDARIRAAGAITDDPQFSALDTGAQTGEFDDRADLVSDPGFVPADDPESNQFVFDENGELIPADSAAADRIRAEQNRVVNTAPAPVTVFSAYENPETGQWEVQNLQTGEIVVSGVSRETAERFAQDANRQGEDSARQEFQDTTQAEIDAEEREATAQAEARLRAQAQATFQKWRKQANDGDWRVRLRLAPNATCLYKNPDGAGILQPLAVTDGVVFPYTPRITTAYRAEYSEYKLTHSNYRGFFYQNSSVDDIQIEATFTAQDTYEAEYLLAVIHFFRSVTKMFYGARDPQAGSPPPLVYLQGFGEYQFNVHPCVVAQFNYNLPNDVDYIRARSKNITSNTALQMLNRRQRQDLPTNPFSSAWSRIKNVLEPQGVKKGAVPTPPAPPTLGIGSSLDNNPTYVPTKLDMTLILHPIQSRQQVSKEFNMQSFANGNLLRGGFW